MVDPRTNVASSQFSDEDGELDLKDIFAQVLARIHWVIIAVITGAAIGAFQGQLPPNIYRSDAVVQIEQRADRVMLPSELIGDMLTGERSGSSGLDTEVHIIRSRLVLAPVVTRLDEQTVVEPALAPVVGGILRRRDVPVVGAFIGDEYARPGEAVEAALTEVPDAYQGAGFTLRVEGPTRFSVITPDDTVLEGQLAEPLDLPDGGSLLVSRIDAAEGREFTLYQEPLRDSVRRISAGLSIRERGNTGIVDFSYTSGEEGSSVAILNAVIEEYINQNLRRRSVEIDRSIAFIDDQLIEISEELRTATAELSAYRQGQQVDELSVGTQELLDAGIQLEAQLDELAFRKERLLQVLTVNHPDIQSIELEEARLEDRLEDIRADLALVPEVEQELARLVQRVERAQTLEQQLRARVEQLRILRASTVGNIRVLEPAETARLVGPDRRGPIGIGAGIGLLLSVGLVFGLNFLRSGIEDGRDIEKLGLPLFATVNKSAQLVGKDASSPAYGLALHDPDDPAVEALRGLRTGLKFAQGSVDVNSFMLTSCAPSDGKSFIALNLAIVAGKTGARVLLVDADMRRGFLRRFFELDREQPGLSDFLTGTTQDCVCHYPEASIDFMSTGRFPPNPSELLDGQRFRELLAEANERYDLVIVDAPPVLAVADPAVIGQHVGLSMLVVRHLQTTTTEIEAAQKSLGTAGVRLSGAILNQFDQEKSRYGRYGQRYGYYAGGYQYSYRSGNSRM